MSRLVTLLLVILGTSKGFCAEEVTVSPKHTFEIVQKYEDGWTESLHFFRKQDKDIILEPSIPWPALFYISPDDHWMLRIQKSGSGDNISYLYRVESGQSVWRMEEQVGELAFIFLGHQPAGLPSGLYHTGVEFVSWDLKAGLLNFTVHGSGDQSGTGIERSLRYDLNDNRIVSP